MRPSRRRTSGLHLSAGILACLLAACGGADEGGRSASAPAPDALPDAELISLSDGRPIHWIAADDDTVYCGVDDRGIEAIVLATGEVRWSVPDAHPGGVARVVLLGDTLYSTGDDDRVCAWSTTTGELLRQATVISPQRIGQLWHDASGSRLLACTRTELWVFDPRTLELRHHLNGSEPPDDPQSAQGQLYRSLQGGVYIEDAVVLPGRSRVLFSIDQRRSLWSWDMESGELSDDLMPEGTGGRLHQGRDGRALYVSRQRLARYDARDLGATPEDVGAGVGAIREDARGGVLAAGVGRQVRVWDGESGQTLATLEGHTRIVGLAIPIRGGRNLVSFAPGARHQPAELRMWRVNRP
ncbi:MAG: hypothetical protein O2816_11685 [Planctomycetota bacterium]|nr:hypothetical protein [Planctomycetota bacterium]